MNQHGMLLALLLIFLMLIIIVLRLSLDKKIQVKTGNDGTKDVQAMVPLKHLRNF